MKFHTYKNYAALVAYSGNSSVVCIPDKFNGLPVTHIHEKAFAGKKNLEYVFLMGEISHIDDYAFHCCPRLSFIGPPDDFTRNSLELCQSWEIDPAELGLSEYKEDFCESKLPSVCFVGKYAFSGTAIENLCFGSHDVSIDIGAFSDCKNLHSVNFAGCQELTIERYAFRNAGLETVLAPAVEFNVISECAFYGNKHLKTFVASGIDVVEDGAFEGCAALETIPSPKSVGKRAFFGCSMLTANGKAKRPAKKATQKTSSAIAAEATPPEPTPDPDALLMLIPASDKIMLSNIEKTGIFEKLHDEEIHMDDYFFIMNGSSHPCRLNLDVPSWKEQAVLPILDYLAEQKIRVILRGESVWGKNFLVKSICPGSTEHISEDFFMTLLSAPAGETNVSAKSHPELKSVKEMDIYMQIYKNQIPAWVKAAFQHNLAVFREATTDISMRNHVVRTMRLLCNIDWEPHFHLDRLPSIAEAEAMLNERFYGLESQKTELLQILAQMKHAGRFPDYGLLLEGAPGTGKTAMAMFMSQILGLPLVRIDLSEIGKEASGLIGTQRAYSNAEPSIFCKKMQRNRIAGGILLLNEIDKAPEGCNITDILLPALDHMGSLDDVFMEIEIPMDNFLVVATANDASNISDPLLDRFQTITFRGYSKSEKIQIFSKILQEKLNAENLATDSLQISPQAAEILIAEYCRDAGIRAIQKAADKLIRHFIFLMQTQNISNLVVQEADIRQIFGKGCVIERHLLATPGVATAGFYYKGQAHFVRLEATTIPGKGRIKCLGSISTMQREFCEVSYYALRNPSFRNIGNVDVILTCTDPIPAGCENKVGLAAYIAMASHFLDIKIKTDSVFVGGVTLNRSLFWTENDVAPLFAGMEEHGIHTVFAPLGVSDLIEGNFSVNVVEALDATTMLTAVLANNLNT